MRRKKHRKSKRKNPGFPAVTPIVVQELKKRVSHIETKMTQNGKSGLGAELVAAIASQTCLNTLLE